MNKGLLGKISLFFLVVLLIISALLSILPVSADVDPGQLQGYNFCGGNPCPTWVNLTKGDMFFTDGDNVYIIANISCSPPHVCNSTMIVDANFSQIGGNELRTGVFKQNGTDASWAVFEFNGTVNFSSLSIQQIQPKNITMNASVINDTSGTYESFDLPSFIATVLLVNMSTFGCPPAGESPQFPMVPGYNISASLPVGPTQAVACTQNATLCQYTDTYGPGTWNGTNWLVCAPSFGGATTNFNTIASTGNFSAIPNFTIEVPGKAKIVFQTNISFNSQEESQAIMQFAMKSAMGGGRIGINDTEFNGQNNKPNLNLTARLTIYNVSNQIGQITGRPQILRTDFGGGNMQGCPPTICSDITWDGENLTFSVSSFSSYTITDAINVTINTPGNNNWTNNRTINFTYTPVWNSSITMDNCTLWGNFSGNWEANETNSTALVNGTTNGIVNTADADGIYIWNVECYDNTGLGDTGVSNYTIKVDTAGPKWYTVNNTSIVSAYSPSTLSHFNITWNDTASGISNVFITIRNSTNASHVIVSNASMSNATYLGDIYNYSIILPAGTFNWTSYSNDSLNNWNSTDTWTFTISKADNILNLYLNGTLNDNKTYTYPEVINATATSTALSGNVYIYRNDALPVQTCTVSMTSLIIACKEEILLGNGTYVYKINSTGGQNYSDNTTGLNFSAFVNKGVPDVKTFINENTANTTISYSSTLAIKGNSSSGGVLPALFNISITNVTTTSQSVSISNTSQSSPIFLLPSIGNGTYRINLTYDGNSNWSSTYNNTLFLFVTKGTPTLNLYLGGVANNSSVTYPSIANITANESMTGDDDCTYILYRNGTQLVNGSNIYNYTKLGYGVYEFKYNVSACTNWTSGTSSTYYLTVSKGSPTLSLTIDGVAASKTVTYGTTTSTVGSESNDGDSDFNYTLYRNTDVIGNGSSVTNTQTLVAGTYTYVYNTSGGTNWTSGATSSFVLTVNAASSSSSSSSSSTTSGTTTTVKLAKGNVNITSSSITTGGKMIVTVARYEDVAIRGMNITVSNNVANVKLVVRKLPTLPASVAYDVDSKVYHYINIEPTNITDSDINAVNMEFAVNKTWLTNNNVAASNITLYRWANNKWNDLNATKINENAQEAFYNVKSPGLSVFVIGSKGAVTTAPTETIICTESWSCSDWSTCANNVHTRTCTDSNNCGTIASKPSESESCGAGQAAVTSPTSFSYLTFVIVIVILIIVSVFIFLERAKITLYLQKLSKRPAHHEKPHQKVLEELAEDEKLKVDVQ